MNKLKRSIVLWLFLLSFAAWGTAGCTGSSDDDDATTVAPSETPPVEPTGTVTSPTPTSPAGATPTPTTPPSVTSTPAVATPELTPTAVPDADGDGYAASEDCDDTDPTVNPGATEICDTIDNDCDGVIDGDNAEGQQLWYADADGDGFGADVDPVMACTRPEGFADNDQDCDDTNPDINPEAEEVCDDLDLDENCNGLVDDADSKTDPDTFNTFYPDVDRDGFGDENGAPVMQCDAPKGYVDNNLDCNDEDDRFNPAAAEDDCTDPNDYNCDGTTGYADADGDGYAACQDCDDSNPDINPGAIEVCDPDNVDENCNGLADDEDPKASDPTKSHFYVDADQDGYGDENGVPVALCDAPEGYVDNNDDCNDEDPAFNPAAVEDDCTDPNDYNCDGSIGADDIDGDGVPACQDCNDHDPAISPNEAEICDPDNVDEDCDGLADDQDDDTDALTKSVYYLDTDGDGYGDSADSGTLFCDPPDGYVLDNTDCDDTNPGINPGIVEDDCTDLNDYNCDGFSGAADLDGDGFPTCNDCDDTNPDINPGVAEICDANDVDENCNGVADDADATVDPASQATYYPDGDGDGYGDQADPGTLYCDPPEGYLLDNADCNDADPVYNPAAVETDCSDPNDYNCDGYAGSDDNDGDGYQACEDCNDTDPAINPGATEVCDDADVDEDCDGLADDEDDSASFRTKIRAYVDKDGDGYGDSADDGIRVCDVPPGYADNNGDCDDANENRNPGLPEVCDPDNVDENCNGLADNRDSTTDPDSMYTFYPDEDGDDYGDMNAEPLVRCDVVGSYSILGTDCDDANADINPAVEEVCDDGIDNNCDTMADCDDEQCSSTPQCIVSPCPYEDLGSVLGEAVATGNTEGMGANLSGSCGSSTVAAQDVGYSWTAPAAGTYIISTDWSDFDTVLYLLDTDCEGSELACDDDSGEGTRSMVEVDLAEGQTIVIVVDGYNQSASGVYQINIYEAGAVTPTPAPTGTPVPTATPAPGTCQDVDLGSAVGDAVYSGTTVGAGDDFLLSCDFTSGNEDVSFRWVAPDAGTYVIDTNGSSFDTALAILSTCDGPELDCDDDSGVSTQSLLTYTFDAGQEVVIVVDGSYYSSGGDFVLNINPEFAPTPTPGPTPVGTPVPWVTPTPAWATPTPPPPSCPEYDLGTSVGTAVAEGSTSGATSDYDPSCAYGTGASDVTLLWTAPETGSYIFDTIGSSFDTALMLYDACDGTEIACDDDSGGTGYVSLIRADFSAGESVIVVVDGGLSSSAGSFVLNITPAPAVTPTPTPSPTPEPLPCPEIDLGSQLGQVATGSNDGAGDDFVGSCTWGTGGQDVTFGWTAPDTATYTFDTIGSDIDTVLYAYAYGDCGGAELGCNDDASGVYQSALTLDLNAGDQIVLVVDGYSSSSGSTGGFVLNITQEGGTPACTAIYDIQDTTSPDHPAEGALIDICPAVVTAVRSNGTFYMQAPDGGPYSGIFVYQSSSSGITPSGLAIGDVVEVTGTYVEYNGLSEINLTTDSANSSVTIVDSVQPLQPEVIADPASIGTNIDDCNNKYDGSDAEAYESVLVAVAGVTVTSVDPCGQGSYGIWRVDDALNVDDVFDYTYTPVVGDSIDILAGVLTYAYSEFRLLPRNDRDIALAAEKSVTFEVTVPTNTPYGDTIYVTGNIPELGDWAPDALPLEPVSDSVWSTSVLIPTGTSFEYKYTRGTWDTVEGTADCGFVDNRIATADTNKTLTDTIVGWEDCPVTQLACATDLDIGSQTGYALATGTNAAATDDFSPTTCATTSSGGKDVTLAWTPPADDCYYINTVGSDYDTVVYVLEADCTTEVACNDDTPYYYYYYPFYGESEAYACVSGGVPYVIVIDGFDSNETGTYQLSIF